MKKLITFLMLLSVFGIGNVWADSPANFTFTSKWRAYSQTIAPITVTFSEKTSDNNGFRRFKNSATMSIAAENGYNITGITVTFTTSEGKLFPTEGQITASPGSLSFDTSAGTCTWTGAATNSIVLTKDATGHEFDITGISVAYTTAAPTEYDYVINIADLRFEHLTYNPGRTGIYGFDITSSGWQSQTSGDDFSLLLSPNTALSNNSFTVAVNSTNSSAKITQMVIVGEEGTFSDVTAVGTNVYTTTKQEQLIWQNATGDGTATISFTTSSKRPAITQIYVKTNQAMTYIKQTPSSLAFSPNTSGTADPNITDYQIDSRLKMGDQYFRADSYTVSNSGSNTAINQYHLSTGKIGVNTGTAGGTATITANFDGTSNPFYNTASANYELTIAKPVKTKSKTITIDDMRYSKVASSQGLNANNGLNRTLGGFAFTFSGADGIKYNNGDGIIIRKNDDSNIGTFTITPQNSGTGDIKITRVDIVTNPSSDKTNGTVTVSGLSTNQTIYDVSSFSFPNLKTGEDDGVEAFTMTAVSGTIDIKSFTIYYSLTGSAALDDAKVTPTLTWDRPSDSVTSGSEYTSPVLTTNPSNYDVTITNNNTDVATVKSTNRNTPPLITLSGEDGTATITASAAASDFFNAAENAVYKVNVTPTTVSEKWNFTTLNVTNTINDTEWSDKGDYYQNKFIAAQNATYSTSNASSQIYKLQFGRNNSGGLEAGQIRLHSSFMTFTNSAMLINVPVTAGQKVLVTFDGGNGTTEAGFKISNATVDGDAGATKILSDATQTTATLTATETGYVTLETTKSKVKLYKIEVKNETRKNLDLRDSGSNTYERYVGTGTESSNDNHFNHRVVYTDNPLMPITYTTDASSFTITSSDPSVLDVSHAYIAENNFGNSSSFYFNNIIPKAAGTATLTITYAGNENYLPSSYTSNVYTVYGPTNSYLVAADNQEIQQGQFSNITPKITDKDGNLLGIRLMEGSTDRYTTYVLGEDEDEPDYSEYFTFSYSAAESGTGSNWEKITVDANGKITTEDENEVAAAVGATRKITVTATPKEAYASAFASTTDVTTELTVTIIEKTANIQVDFFWDADCTTPITLATSTVSGTDNTYADKVNVFNSGIFENGFPNGRVIYAKPKNEGDAIWFSYAQNGDAAVIPANPSIDKKKRIFQYRRGIPIYIDDDLGSEDYVTVNVVATTYDANTKKYNLRGTVARLKFPAIASHDRPDQPTYDPVSPDANASLNKDGRKIMNTAENVVAYGEGASKTNPTGNGTLVYGKFSTGTVYTTEQLINEKAVQQGTGSVPVVSTEVAKRRFTSVQVKHYNDSDPFGEADYISEQTYTEYWYKFDTDLRLYSDAKRTTALESYSIGINSSTTKPYYKVMWYNKRNYEDQSNNSLGESQEVDDYAGKISFAITGYNGTITAADATVNADGIVTVSNNKEGWVKVTATYSGGEQHGGKSGETYYTSTTDESSADFYVYIYDATKEVPTITPQSRNFTGMMTYTIAAPANWDVVYTTDGTNPVVPTSGIPSTNYIAHAESVSKKIGTSTTTITVDFAIADDATHTVKAIAYNPNDRSQYSAIVSEAYTKKAPLPSPTFDPSGVGTPYVYNTNELTVQIACSYPNAVIYYTTDGKEPVIGASNTYKYSGLSKVVISGNVTITAVAYDPEAQIYSAIIPSVYQYSSEMNKPYFQISTDNGATWYGYNTEDASSWVPNGKAWYNGQTKEITPSTQIRIVDPNPVTGTIFYTTNGDVPADNATTLIYSEGYPFTVGKTTIGQAITILEDAQSPVSTAEFIITGTNSNVWEAVDETTTKPSGKEKRGIYATDGFVISTDKNLKVNNNGTIVNLNSIKTDNGGTASKTYAQENITATFSGYDFKDWEEMTIADAAIGAPLNGVGDYSIKSSNNAKYEAAGDDNCNHAYTLDSYCPTLHEKTFKLPAQGTYVRFEPEKDGDLSIWVLQQGALLYEDDTYFVDNVLRMRPVYLIDEQGKSQKVKVVNNVPQLWSSARLSENWTKIQAQAAANGWMDSKYIPSTNKMSEDAAYTQYIHLSDGKLFKTLPSGGISVTKISDVPVTPSDPTYVNYYKKVINKGPNREETAAIYNLYKADLDKNYVSVGDPIKPFAIHTGSTISLNDGKYVDNSDDQTGYVLASGGYAKYTFEVKAGKTYFFFAQGSKIGIRGFQFVPTETGTRPEVAMDKALTTVTVDNVEKSLANAISDCAGKTVNVTLSNRSFTTNWTTLVLPFSVSVAQIEKVFGAKTDIVIFDDITGATHNTIHMTRHWHKMIVAGTPVLIKPTTAITNPKFKGVQLEASVVDEITGSCDDFTMTGTMVLAEGALKPNDWYVNTSGKFTYLKGNNPVNVNGSYGWLRKKSDTPARMLTTEMGSIIDENSGETTGIIDIELPTDSGNVNIINYDTNVYSINGQVVSRGSLKNLPKGIYIVNGKKVVVK